MASIGHPWVAGEVPAYVRDQPSKATATLAYVCSSEGTVTGGADGLRMFK